MRIEKIEVYSDVPNMAVLRHPGREFPGLLLQGDTLNALCVQIADVLAGGPDALDDLEDLQSRLLGMLSHYISVLEEHDLKLPFPMPAVSDN
ncbi:DUF6959 family protein [Stenotrophomonas pigmentata]|uniref:DUF6959 family protein n=1 Tax=Stenotrophomonas pigmentata TaxID=3055080 RepID=UPI0026F1E1BA|nr:hypothetical protein [Stenotrophomonas sp. 610A2]